MRRALSKKAQALPAGDDHPLGAHLVVVALCLMLCAVPLAYLPQVYESALIPKLLALHLCIALACLGWLLQTRLGRAVRLTSSPLVLPVLCWMGAALLSSHSTTHPLDTCVELLNQAALLALFFVVANALPPQRLGPILWTNAGTGLIVALIGILQYHNLAFVDIPTAGHPSATFAYRNLAAEYLICALPLTGLLFFTVQRRAGLWLSGLSATLMGVYLIYTRTRACWVGAGGALLCVGGAMALWPPLRRSVWEALRSGWDRRRGSLALGFGVLFVLLSILPPRFQDTSGSNFQTKAAISTTITSIVEKGGDKGRLMVWRNTLRLIADHPLLGVGPGGWKRVYPLYDRGDVISAVVSPQRPHNDYIWIAAEHGLIGLGIYLYLLVTAFRCLLAMARSPEHSLRIAALMFALSLLSILGDAFFSFPREWPHAMMFPYLLFGIIASATKGERDRRTTGPQDHPKVLERWNVLTFKRSNGLWSCGQWSVVLWSAVCRLLPYLLLAVSLTAAVLSWRRIGFDRHYRGALLTQDQGDWPAVLAEARRALEYGTFRPHILYFKGVALQNLKRYLEAEAAFRQNLVYTPYSWYAHNGLCLACIHQGRLENALSHGKAALSIYPGYAEAHNNLGLVLMNKGDLDSAIREWQQALSIDPNLVQARNNLGIALMNKGDLDSAIREWRQALSIDPSLAQAHSNLGIALMNRGDRAGAVQAFRAYIRLSADEGMKQKARDLIRELGDTP